jgi:DNA-binding transcriptional MerR regulator
MAQPPFTIGQVARRFRVSAWKVRRLFERGLLPEPARVGAYRVIPPDDLPKIEAALRRAGYLPEGGPHAA